MTADGGILITTGTAAGGVGTRRLAVAHGPRGWTVDEGKTWNHPVLVGDVLLVRNGQEMVAFRLSLARR